MFKRPRKTMHTDIRRTYESVHEDIMKRLECDLVEQSSYLNDIMPLIHNIDNLSTKELRAMFQKLAHNWMTSDERKIFANDSDNDGTPDSDCKICLKKTVFLLSESDAVYVCSECGWTRSFIGASSERYLPYDFEPPPPSCPYRRSNHFQEWLNAFMARQSGSVPEEIFEQIRTEMKKQRLSDYNLLTQKRLRSIMKSLRLNKYYENAPFILYHLKGEKPPTLSREVEDELRTMFDKIQDPFDKVVKIVAPERRNFLSYSYTIFKMLELMELDYLLVYFPLLKSREKLIIQDKIWKEICKEVNWRFIPSI